MLVYATPGQMMLLINGLQHRKYFRADFTVTGETACADSVGARARDRRAQHLNTVLRRAPVRGVQDDELLVSLRMEHLMEALVGLGWLAQRGIRYPIAPYGVQVDPAKAFQVSYAGKL